MFLGFEADDTTASPPQGPALPTDSAGRLIAVRYRTVVFQYWHAVVLSAMMPLLWLLSWRRRKQSRRGFPVDAPVHPCPTCSRVM